MIIVRKDMSQVELLAFMLYIKEEGGCNLGNVLGRSSRDCQLYCPLMGVDDLDSYVNEHIKLYKDEIEDNILEIKLLGEEFQLGEKDE